MPFQNDERDSHPGWKAERSREEKIVKAIRVHEFGGPEVLAGIHAALVAGLERGTPGPVVGQELPLAGAPRTARRRRARQHARVAVVAPLANRRARGPTNSAQIAAKSPSNREEKRLRLHGVDSSRQVGVTGASICVNWSGYPSGYPTRYPRRYPTLKPP